MNCLNCNSEVSGSYCSHCGQKTSTARFTFKHIFKADIANQVYSFFKSEIFFTLRELFTRPGYSIKEYIQGKRVNHMNYMSFYLLLTTIGIFLDKYAKVSMAKLSTNDKNSEELLSSYFDLLKNNPKTIIALTIPIVSVFTYLFFKKSKFNLPEHLIMNIYKASAILVITKVVTIFSLGISNLSFLRIVDEVAFYGTIGYSIWFIYQFFEDDKLYSKKNLIIRSCVATLLGVFFSRISVLIYWLLTLNIKQ